MSNEIEKGRGPSWWQEQFDAARERSESLPAHARPVVTGGQSGRTRSLPLWAQEIVALGADVQPGRCEDCGLHVWLWLCVRYDDDGERHQPRCDECKQEKP